MAAALSFLLTLGCLTAAAKNNHVSPSVTGNYIGVLDQTQISEMQVADNETLMGQLPEGTVLLDISYPYVLLGSDGPFAQQKLENCPLFTSVEPDCLIEVSSYTNDTYSDRQWNLHDPFSGLNVEQSWLDHAAVSDTARTVVVAVIDTGIDTTHPDLAESMWINENEIPDDGVDNDRNGYVDDIHGWDFYHGDNTVCHYVYDEEKGQYLADPTDSDNHGTHVAGVIAAASGNQEGISGAVGPFPVKIMSLKALGGGTASSPGTGSMFQTIKAIQYATQMGADICNLSWGNSTYSAALEQAIRESDMLFVAAAGNTSSNNDTSPIYPASLPLNNILSVAGTDQQGRLAEYSNYGAHSVDMAAPSEKITSTIVGTYATMSGTSMAVPHVTAVAAMLYSSSEYLYASGVREVLLAGSRYLPALEGYLRNPLSPDASITYAGAAYLKEDTVAPEFTWNIIYETANIQVQIDASDVGGSDIRTIRYIFGTKDVAAFRRGTEGLTCEDGIAWLSKPGDYTFYVSDYAGNETVQTISVRQVVSESLTLPHSRKTILTGETYQLKYDVQPLNHTDALTFTSSNPDILQVDVNGLITGLAPGWADIEIRTASGLTGSVKIKVR